MKEIWREIPGYEGRYMASNLGRVWSIARTSARGKRGGHVMRPCDNGKGYLHINMRQGVRTKKQYIHRLVFLAHVGPIPAGLDINHIDGNKANNCVANLEVLTHSQNLKHAYDTGLHPGTPPRYAAVVAERNGEHAARFDSILDAAEAAGVAPCSVCHALAGRTKLCGGFKWRYAS